MIKSRIFGSLSFYQFIPLILGLMAMCGVCILYSLPGIHTYFHWRERTSPLPLHVIKDICKKFSIQENDRLCGLNSAVYAPDFYPIIQEYFQALKDAPVTYSQVNEKLAIYRDYCEPKVVQADDAEYFRCFYDLRGDKVYPIAFYFYGDRTLWKSHYNLEKP